MKILLVDVDSKIPNLALMKISTYHKQLGNNVVLKKIGLDGYPKKKHIVVDAFGYDNVYASTLFVANQKCYEIKNCKNIEIGGTGYDIEKKLPIIIDDLDPDYSIYPENDTSVGFITRGCVRDCYFCVVRKKEGLIYKYRDINQIVKHKKVDFLDNNILAYNKHLEILQELIDKKIYCWFNSGLDIRLINDKNAELLSKLKYLGEYTFAFDLIENEEIINKKLQILKKYIDKDWKLKFDLYVNPKDDISDILFRINWCRKNKVLPYVMRDKSCWESENNEFYVDLAAYCNQPNIFKKMSWEEFLNKRHTKQERIQSSLNLWREGIKNVQI